MNVLLDTNTLMWWLGEPERLPAAVLEAMENKADSMVVSAAVALELASKTSLGKIKAQPLLATWEERLAREDFAELAIQARHAIRAWLLPPYHRDPFDRLLIAQALITGWPIISPDRVFDSYGVRRIW